ncbi:MAG: helix-turn-helix domain-containing protein [Candidatus Paceibacterota bacterium]
MLKEKSLLQNLGLDKHEAFIYEKLLEKETNSISDIERTTKLHRPQIYMALHKLQEKSLVHTINKGKRKYYTATSPQAIEQLFTQKEKEFFDYVENLHHTYEKSHSSKPDVTFSEGKEAIQKTYSDIPKSLKKDDMYYRYMPVSKLYRSKYIPKNYREERDKKGLERLIITSKHTMHAKSNHLTRSVKAVPPTFDLFEYEMSLTMYKDKVVLVDFETESVIEIKHQRFAEFQKKVFKLLFSKL